MSQPLDIGAAAPATNAPGVLVRLAMGSLAALALAGGGALAAPTPAGTVISNQAQATIDGEEVVPSNRVDTVVQAVCRPGLGPAAPAQAPGQQAAVVPPSTAYLTYVLTNQGNAQATFALGHSVADGGAWTPAAVDHYLDANANGLVDPNEELVDAVSLDAGGHARLVLAVTPPAGALGAVTLTPTADCGDLPSNDAYASVEAREPLAAALRVQVALTEAGPDPFGASRYRIVATLANYGGGLAIGAELEVDLDDLVGAGFLVDLDAVEADRGLLLYEDPTSGGWVPAPSLPSGPPTALRLDLPTLDPDEAAVLRLGLVGPEEPVPGIFPVVVTGSSADEPEPVRTVGYLEVAATHAHALERVGQGAVDLVEGQPRCVPFRLTNEGTAADTYRLAAAVSPTPVEVRVALQAAGGLPLPATVALAPGAAIDLAACVEALAPTAEPFTVTVNADSDATGESAAASVEVASVAPADGLVLTHAAEPAGTVRPGARIAYTLTIRNAFDFPLNGIRVRDDLDPDVSFVSGSDDYTRSTHVARWDLGTLAPGESATVRLETRVSRAAADDTVITNRFAVTAQELPDPVLSSTVRHATWSSALLLETTVAPQSGVTYGDALTYTLRVTNASDSSLDVTIEERLADGVELLDAADGAGETWATASAAGSFQHDGDALTWSGLPLAGGESLTVTYRARVLPTAPLELVNRTVARGDSAQGAAVESAVATAALRLDPGVFERDGGVLVGRVYLELDGLPGFTGGADQPLAGVRLVLGGGAQALTDDRGRYAFRGVPVGTHGLLIDPGSLPFEPLPAPNALSPYRYLVAVRGVTVQDVAAAAPTGSATAALTATLELGPLTVTREVVPGPDGDVVRLELTTTEPLDGVVVTDRLADGSEWTRTIERLEGTTVISFSAGGTATDAVPSVTWRYP